MPNKKRNILMLDDDLIPHSSTIAEERLRLQPWLRWLKTGGQEENFNLIECNDFKTFINEVKAREAADPSSENYIHGIIIDIMWKKTTVSEETFKLINYPDVRVNPLEAGVQFLRLWFKENSAVPRALLAHKNRQIAVLSSLPGVGIPLAGLPENITTLSKTTDSITATIANQLILVPNKAFQTWANNLNNINVKVKP
jgi:hypothetical protein